MTSQLKTALLLGLLTALILLLGGAMGGRGGLYVAFVLALVMNVGSYWYSDRMVLAMYGARELSPADAPALHAMVEELAHNAGVPKPRVALIPQDAPNAFATGRDPQHAVVAVTQGIMRLLSPEELRGVLAHEMAHVANRDILIQSIAATLGGVIMYVASMIKWAALFGFGGRDEEGEGSNPIVAIALAIVAPIAAMLIQMAISRSREYLADETGARISGTPLYLASALEKLTTWSQQVPMHDGSPATAHMFIVNPFTGQQLANLFSTHPPVEERVSRLRAMAGGR
ncbi:heat shock protein HtpX [Desulfobaculum xiamenense]|uniref:Protease HtpX homolog n=1 Tax=Desulfobaculum xiamenense TaxID=995050 RepID=A0A846QQ44_9BACT|nr:zinc metalloprotease HtpX [Desulfobaculum xiamenense]NJB69297.1 heat shock protein HtpX [Desulfobaculum xiamenense]